MAAPTNRDSDKFIVRLPDGMRDRIKVAAEWNNRSMNAEIVAALEEKYPPREAGVQFLLGAFKSLDDDMQGLWLERALEAYAQYKAWKPDGSKDGRSEAARFLRSKAEELEQSAQWDAKPTPTSDD